MDTNEYCDLLVVDVNSSPYVVEAPTHEAFEGDLVEFVTDLPMSAKVSLLGTVVETMFCEKDGREYRCMSAIHSIYPARKIYKAMWVEEEQTD